MAKASSETTKGASKDAPAQPAHVLDLKPGQYSDGHPLDEVQYLECKLILKPDRFTSAHVFQEYGALDDAQSTAFFDDGYNALAAAYARVSALE